MSEQATERLMVRASPERVLEVLLDFDRYPDWAADLKEVEVLDRDGEGRPTNVRFRAAAFGRSTSYTLAYDHGGAPRQLSWKLVQGDLTSKLDGTYVLDPSGDETEVTYHLEVDLRVPIPGFVKRRAEGKIIHTALKELKARVEQPS